MHLGTMLNAYPDSLGANLSEAARLLSSPQWRDAFRSFYLLPTLFNSDLDEGFSIISYDLCESLAKREDLLQLRKEGFDLTCDIVLNHLSVLSPQFQDILQKGDASEYRDFFIDWNRFWDGCGIMTEAGYIMPTSDKFAGLSLRKNSMPILMVRFPDGREIPYWNTFYQEVLYPSVDVFDLMKLTDNRYDAAMRLSKAINSQLAQGLTPKHMDWTGFEVYRAAACDLLEGRRRYLGQMDVNVQSPLVWAWYDQVMAQLADYGMSTVRLDAYTRLHKEPGRKNFMNEPETWDILTRIIALAKKHGLEVLPEIHATYTSGAYRKLADLGCISYDYFLPGLVLDALDTADATWLCRWAAEQIANNLRVVNMLGCHDGIPMRDMRGSLPDERVDALIDKLVQRGGRLKMIHGDNPEVYQMDTTYYSALGCNDAKLLMARAIQLFMPGKPQIWYVDLLAGENDLSVFQRDPSADNRCINRHRFTLEEIKTRQTLPVVAEQLSMLSLRNTHPAFTEDATITVEQPEPHRLRLSWQNDAAWATLDANLQTMHYEISHSD